MEGLETPYEVEAAIEFIDCTVCNKSIRGDTLYKIHLTTAGHMKKEDALVSQGLAVREHTVPDFEDIVQYLQYLKIDEPIIGLNYLDEVPGTDPGDPQPGPRYLCRLCELHANLPNMVNHIIGRKHRQKYLQTKRPDLVTWDRTSMTSQSGKIIRAKAEVVERQDGPGTPKPMKKNRTVGKSNISRVNQRQKPKMDQNVYRTVIQRELLDYQDEYSDRGRYPRNDSDAPPFHPNDHSMLSKSERGTYRREDPLTQDHMEEEQQRTVYMESDTYRHDVMETDYDREYQEDYAIDEHRRDLLEPGGVRGHDPRGEMPRRQVYSAHTYSEEAAPSRRSYPESDPLKEFYSAEVRRGQVRSAEAAQSCRNTLSLRDLRGTAYPKDDPERYSSEGAYPHEAPRGRAYPPEESSRDYTDYSDGGVQFDDHTRKTGGYFEEEPQCRTYPEDEPLQSVYPEDESEQWPLEREPGRYGNMNGGGRQGSGDPEAKRRRFPEPVESEKPYDKDHLLEMVRAFRQERRAPRRQEPVGIPEPSRPGPPAPQRPLEVGSTLSEIPEPFRRFLQGGIHNEDQRKRKRKSRFSDATEEEMERAKGLFTDASRSPDLEGHIAPALGPSRQEIHGPPRLDPYTTSQSPYPTEFYQRGTPKSLSENTADPGAVFDLLKNVEIDNAEEADFLKNKLCNLLKEFQAKKSQATVHKSQGHTVISKEYNHLSDEQQASPRGQYERPLREGPDGRRFENQPRPQEDFYPKDAPRGRGWEEQEQEQMPEEDFQEYSHPAHHGPRSSSRSRYEEVFGRPETYKPPHAAHPQEPAPYPERFQEPAPPYNYPSAAEEYFDSRFPTPPLPREKGYRVHRGPQQSSSLDKITSTLLELVARK